MQPGCRAAGADSAILTSHSTSVQASKRSDPPSEQAVRNGERVRSIQASFVTCALLIVGIAGAAQAQTGRSISGRVTDRASGLPLQNAFVTLTSVASGGSTVGTAADGSYRFSNLVSGPYFSASLQVSVAPPTDLREHVHALVVPSGNWYSNPREPRRGARDRSRARAGRDDQRHDPAGGRRSCRAGNGQTLHFHRL